MIFYTYVAKDVCKILDIYTNPVALNMIKWDFIIKKKSLKLSTDTKSPVHKFK